MLQQIIASLISVGGLGFMNYYVATQLDVIELSNKEERTFFAIVCSIINYLVYQCLYSVIHNYLGSNWSVTISLILTIIISFFASLFLTVPLSKMIMKELNKNRTKHGNAEIINGTSWNQITNYSKDIMCYVYDFSGNYVTSGWLQFKDNHKLSFVLYPFDSKLSQDDLLENLKDQSFIDKYNVYQYFDSESKLLVYVISLV